MITIVTKATSKGERTMYEQCGILVCKKPVKDQPASSINYRDYVEVHFVLDQHA
jgi:hypothetical protein